LVKLIFAPAEVIFAKSSQMKSLNAFSPELLLPKTTAGRYNKYGGSGINQRSIPGIHLKRRNNIYHVKPFMSH